MPYKPDIAARRRRRGEGRVDQRRDAAATLRRWRPGLHILLLLLLLALCVVVSTGLGYVRLSVGDVARIIVASAFGIDAWLEGVTELHRVVVTEVRLPRILTAAAVGAGLSVAGAVFQGILRNPLADPYTLGVSAGAAFGASVALLFDVGLPPALAVPLLAFAGGAGTLVLVVYLSASGGGLSSNNLILSGIIVAAILSAGISFLKYLADEQVAIIIFWLMGSFASRTWADVALTTGCLAVGTGVCLFFARDLNLMALGNRSAASLGVSTGRVTLILLVTASVLTAICVSVSGIIGFVGLLVPHIVRAVGGPDNRRLIPAALLVGAILLLAADTVTRAVLRTEVPIGVLTALIGGPVFCYIFRRRQMARTGF